MTFRSTQVSRVVRVVRVVDSLDSRFAEELMNAPGEDSNGRYFGHSPNADGAGVPEPLADHLHRVAELVQQFAAVFGAEQQAHAAALLHDLGKYADRFQRRLLDSGVRAGDHWTIGSLLLAQYGKFGILPACAAAAHHTGLGLLPFNVERYRESLTRILTTRPGDFTEIKGGLLVQRFRGDGFTLPASISAGLVLRGQFAADMLDARMLFSALVDADYLATEGHFNGSAAQPFCPRHPGPDLDLDSAITALDHFLESVRQTHRDAPMAAAREMLHAVCLAMADRPQGLFTLSSPTGSGKTLAMLAFALRHARRHGLRRIILVMPFLNIIDQTATTYRKVFSTENGFGEHTVLENHSLAARRQPSEEGESDQACSTARLLAENWDAPIILTTTVQFFESLMADRPAQCRKLHRLAESVILFDEAQTLPPKLAVATLSTLARLAETTGPFRSTVVFATATQPALDGLNDRIRNGLFGSGWQPMEIVAETEHLFAQAAGRVHVDWRHRTPIELDDLADELAKHRRVLCIVNLKRHAIQLATMLRDRHIDGLLHLSTNMCPAHRAKALKRLDQRLRSGAPVRLIATQCVEAGVDIDFPVVYRACAAGGHRPGRRPLQPPRSPRARPGHRFHASRRSRALSAGLPGRRRCDGNVPERNCPRGEPGSDRNHQLAGKARHVLPLPLRADGEG